MSILDRFSKCLTSIEYPKTKTSWNIAGIIKGQNAFYKFDVRNMFKLPNNTFAQKNNINTKADKMVLEMKDQWIILDLEELNKYIITNKKKIVHLEELLSNLQWNIILLKYET